MASEPNAPANSAPHALDGVRVLDLSRILAGPFCGQLLGDLGAEVIKVEAPGVGDDTRSWGPPFLPRPDYEAGHARGESAYFLAANRNKKSVAIDFARPEGADLVRRLAARADIVLENFKVGGLAKYGLDYASLSALNPRLVYCSITGFGQYGPYAPRAGYDFVAQGMGGLMSITGQKEGTPGAEPMKVGVAICDLFTGVYAATAVLAALRHAERTGQGQHIDCALLDSQVAMLANQGLSYLVGGVVGRPLGNAHPSIVPYRTFAARDGALVVACGNDRQFQALCGVIGRADLASEPAYATNPGRVKARDVLEAELERTFATLAAADVIEGLLAAGVPAGPINAIDEVFADPQVEARGLSRPIAREGGEEVPGIAYPPQLSATPADYRRPPPRLGEDTRDVLESELGLEAAEVARLASLGVIGLP